MISGLGKYVRHAIGVMVAAIVGTALAAFGVTPEMLTPEQADAVASATAALETLLWIFLTFVGYPFTEKFLKRFKWLDREGSADREAVKVEAERRDMPGYRPVL